MKVFWDLAVSSEKSSWKHSGSISTQSVRVVGAALLRPVPSSCPTRIEAWGHLNKAVMLRKKPHQGRMRPLSPAFQPGEFFHN